MNEMDLKDLCFVVRLIAGNNTVLPWTLVICLEDYAFNP